MILYVLLCGAQPFRGDTDLQIQKAVRYQQVDMSDDPWPHISDDAKDCVRRMLDRVRAPPSPPASSRRGASDVSFEQSCAGKRSAPAKIRHPCLGLV